MKLVVCSKDIDSTLIKGDLISWHNDGDFEGREVGLFNALSFNRATRADYLVSTPFMILNLPNITYEDIRPIIEDMIYLDNLNVPIADIAAFNEISKDYTSKRKWKIDFSSLELRGRNSVYTGNTISPTRTRWSQVVPAPIRRDTLNAYNEISRADTVISDIKVAR